MRKQVFVIFILNFQRNCDRETAIETKRETFQSRFKGEHIESLTKPQRALLGRLEPMRAMREAMRDMRAMRD